MSRDYDQEPHARMYDGSANPEQEHDRGVETRDTWIADCVPQNQRRHEQQRRERAEAGENQNRCRNHDRRLSILPLSDASDLDINRRCRPLEQVRVEVVALVVDHDEGGEVLDLDAPDRLHAEFLVLLHTRPSLML